MTAKPDATSATRPPAAPLPVRKFIYEETLVRRGIRLGLELLITLLTARAREHEAHGRHDRAAKILGHAQALQGRLENIEWDWHEFDEEDRAQGLEPY